MKKMVCSFIVAAALAVALHTPAWAEAYLATVVRVVDGDTLQLRRETPRGHELFFVRLHGVDTPEPWQGQYKCPAERALGLEATKVATDLVGSIVRVEETGEETWNRRVAIVWVVTTNGWDHLGNALIRLGVARQWDYDGGQPKPDWCGR